MKQYIDRELTNALEDTVRVRLTIDTGDALERELVALANRAARTPTQRATAAGGVLTVEIVK